MQSLPIRGLSRRSNIKGAQWLINFCALEPSPRQFGAPEAFCPGAPSCTWMAGAGPKIWKERGGCPVQDRGCLRGCPLRSGEKKIEFSKSIRMIWCILFCLRHPHKVWPPYLAKHRGGASESTLDLPLNGARLVILIYLFFFCPPFLFPFLFLFYFLSLLSLSVFFFFCAPLVNRGEGQGPKAPQYTPLPMPTLQMV